MKNRQQIKAAIGLRNYYYKQAFLCRNLYEDLVDFYLMYDYYMEYVQRYELALDNLLDENDL